MVAHHPSVWKKTQQLCASAAARQELSQARGREGELKNSPVVPGVGG